MERLNLSLSLLQIAWPQRRWGEGRGFVCLRAGVNARGPCLLHRASWTGRKGRGPCPPPHFPVSSHPASGVASFSSSILVTLFLYPSRGGGDLILAGGGLLNSLRKEGATVSPGLPGEGPPAGLGARGWRAAGLPTEVQGPAPRGASERAAAVPSHICAVETLPRAAAGRCVPTGSEG